MNQLTNNEIKIKIVESILEIAKERNIWICCKLSEAIYVEHHSLLENYVRRNYIYDRIMYDLQAIKPEDAGTVVWFPATPLGQQRRIQILQTLLQKYQDARRKEVQHSFYL